MQVPAVAIEYVYVWNNTSVMVDEVFSHRLGLIPLNVDPALLEVKESPSNQATDRNTVVFKLHIECTRNTAAPRDCTDPSVLYHNSEVRAGHLQWVPQGEQAEVFSARPPAPTIPETVLVKLRPGQAIEIEMHAVKGLGRDHAKFSPVGTCSSPSPLTSLLKNSVWCSDSELPTITAHHLGRSKSCTTTSCHTLPGLLLTRGHQRRHPHQKCLCRQVLCTRRDDES